MYLLFQSFPLKKLVELWKNDTCIGDCCIYGEIGKDTCSMTISIIDNEQGKGYSRLLLEGLVENLPMMDDDQLLFIDVDASAGFWDYLGMKMNRYGLDYKGKRQLIGRGYEKVISWRDIKRFINVKKNKTF